MNGYEVAATAMLVVLTVGALGLCAYMAWEVDKWKGIAALAGLILWMGVMLMLATMGDAARQGGA